MRRPAELRRQPAARRGTRRALTMALLALALLAPALLAGTEATAASPGQDGFVTGMQPQRAGWRGSGRMVRLHGVVTSVNATAHRIDISGLPLWEIVWRSYAHDCPVDPGIDLSAIKPGARVEFVLTRGPDSIYYVSRLKSPPG